MIQLLKNHVATGVAIRGAAMLPEDLWYRVSFGTGYRWPEMCTRGSQAQPLY